MIIIFNCLKLPNQNPLFRIHYHYKANILDLKKRSADCIYAEKNKESGYNKNIYVGNLGSKINTELPEYVPVITPKNELLYIFLQSHLSEDIEAYKAYC